MPDRKAADALLAAIEDLQRAMPLPVEYLPVVGADLRTAWRLAYNDWRYDHPEGLP